MADEEGGGNGGGGKKKLIIIIVAVILLLVIAIVAFLVQRSGRGPSIAHGLYVLALIKLVTPPLMSIPVPVPVPVEVDRPVAESAVAPESPAATVVVGEDRVAAPASVRGAAPSSAPATAEETRSIAWTTMVTGTWLGSVVLALLLALGRAFRFHRILRHARPVDAAVQSDLRDLAARFGRSRLPRVEVLPGRVYPRHLGYAAPRSVIPLGAGDPFLDQALPLAGANVHRMCERTKYTRPNVQRV